MQRKGHGDPAVGPFLYGAVDSATSGADNRVRSVVLRQGSFDLKHAFGLLAAALAALVSTACGSARDTTGPSQPPSGSASVEGPPSLMGPTWRLLTIEGREVLPGARVTAVFATDDLVSGSAGC